MKRFLILLFSMFLISTLSIAQQQKYSRVKVYADEAGFQKISSLGIPIEGEIKKGVYFTCDLSAEQIQKLRNNGFTCEIQIDDVANYYQQRNLQANDEKMPVRSGCGGSTMVVNTPALYTTGSMGGFYTYTQVLAKLDTLAAHYPTLISAKQAISATNTIEGRPIYWVRISNNPNITQTKPRVFFNALTHAREPMGMQQQIFFMMWLLENYATNTDIQLLVNNTEMYFVPCVNPDGYHYNETTNPSGGGMWRKNRRNNGDGTYGVDLNRNFTYEWGWDNTGSSPNGTDDTYRGASQGSEAETQNIMAFSSLYNFDLAINFHCYGNDLIYSWNYINAITPDNNTFIAYTHLLSGDIPFVCGNASQTVGYTSNGDVGDWEYGDLTKDKILDISPEAGESSDGFWPIAARIIPIAKSYVPFNLMAARLVGKYATVTDKSPNLISQTSGYFKYNIQRLGLDSPAVYTVSLQPLSATLTGVGSPKVYSTMGMLQTISDSISFTLDPGIVDGEEIRYLLTVNNGLYDVSDTISKIFGTGVIVLDDHCNNMTNWTATATWNTTTSQYYSSPGSITDSPSGNYGNNINKSITTTNTLDLTDASYATLSFWAKWDIEAGYDYVQAKASIDGGTTWTPLCGKYTHAGSSYQISGEPLFDGTQSSWVQEVMDLTDFVGHNIKIQFTIVSDGGLNYDGFYFDDLQVIKVIPGPIGIHENADHNSFSEPQPNPASDNFGINYSLTNATNNAVFEVYDILGRTMISLPVADQKGQLNVNTSGWRKGIYFCTLKIKNNITELRKLVLE